MRIHLGHHFYGAGNLGDDFMLAGFLAAMRELAPSATFTSCVPFALDPLRQRFPQITWLPYGSNERADAISSCDVWLGLGGSPFQSALSRWFVDHLMGDAHLCNQHDKPMYYLGVGVQTVAESGASEIQRLCAQAAGIWTRDAASAEKLATVAGEPPLLEAAADLAHLFFRDHRPPAAAQGRISLVPNFDYGDWPGQSACLQALDKLAGVERVWVAQESRELPGAERALHAALPEPDRSRWRLVAPEIPGAPLDDVLARWPTGTWLVTARFHAALAGAWAGSRIVVISTNEKLRGVGLELGCPMILPDSDRETVERALASAPPTHTPTNSANQAYRACQAFVRAASAG